MNTNNNDETVFLASSEDWELWNLQFQAQAVAGGLWSEIQGVTCWKHCTLDSVELKGLQLCDCIACPALWLS